jgi:hypothetical protein
MGRPRKNPELSYVQPIEPASVEHEGASLVVNPHQVFHADDSLVKAFPHLFKPLEASRQRPEVEQTTAAPGEVRG